MITFFSGLFMMWGHMNIHICLSGSPNFIFCFLPALKSHSGDPFDTLPKSFWYEFSSPFTESYDDLTEAEPKTTPDPLPFFEDHANSTNVTTQFGSTVNLHCKVNDLRDRTVSDNKIRFSL